MTQEKARELLTGLAQTADGRKTRAYEIADRLMGLIRKSTQRSVHRRDAAWRG